MRRLLKFLHTIGAIGLMGAMACLLVLLAFVPPPSAASEYALMRGAMAAIAKWVFLPSFALTLIAGLLAIGVNRAFHNAGWAWLKLATGILIFESGFVGVLGPMQNEAERSAAALAGQAAGQAVGQAASEAASQAASLADSANLAGSLTAERNTLWVLLAVATLNVVLGIWRPRLTRLPD
ncbi:MAG: hypothetical protein JOZ16_13195 [Methylobacteriaceae bacterium]|nr:hypothetical protein [Methylobacteriaceae bacterium]